MQEWSVLEINMIRSIRREKTFFMFKPQEQNIPFQYWLLPLNFQLFCPCYFREKVMTRNNVSVVDVVKNINLHVSSEPHYPFCLCKFMCSAFGGYLLSSILDLWYLSI